MRVRALPSLIVLVSLSCWSGLPPPDEPDTWRCDTDTDCAEEYTCTNGYCQPGAAAVSRQESHTSASSLRGCSSDTDCLSAHSYADGISYQVDCARFECRCVDVLSARAPLSTSTLGVCALDCEREDLCATRAGSGSSCTGALSLAGAKPRRVCSLVAAD